MGTGAPARSALPAGASWSPRGVCPSVAGGLAGKTLVTTVVRSLARSLAVRRACVDQNARIAQWRISSPAKGYRAWCEQV